VVQNSALQWELDETRALGSWVRSKIYDLQNGGWQATATTAVAAAAAEEAYRITDHLPEWQNETSAVWRQHLGRVWNFLAGEAAEHYALAHAVADFLVSPLNHTQGQDGPDDFDRPQTVAAYAAVLSVIAGAWTSPQQRSCKSSTASTSSTTATIRMHGSMTCGGRPRSCTA
jgi:hypothetical protein